MWLVIGVTLLLTVMATELALSARQQSQTFDEGVHIFAGYRYWKNFDFGANPEHPPLVKLVAALPLLRLPLRTPSIPDADFKMVEYRTGRDFLYGNDANTILWRARMAAAVLTICLGLAVFLVANSMWGAGPAFLALTLFVFEPNFLAHGALVTTDIGRDVGNFSRRRQLLLLPEEALRAQACSARVSPQASVLAPSTPEFYFSRCCSC